MKIVNFQVDEKNYSEYIVRVADFHLNRSIRRQCAAFREGFTSVIDQAWIKLFDQSEFSILVQGVNRVIDVDDLQSHTHYNGFADQAPQNALPLQGPTALQDRQSAEGHVTIQAFWRVLKKFTPEEREKFLRFVTSHSRAPLRGFRDLEPNFTIMNTKEGKYLQIALEGQSRFVCLGRGNFGI